jgi:hypothetical protein
MPCRKAQEQYVTDDCISRISFARNNVSGDDRGDYSAVAVKSQIKKPWQLALPDEMRWR